jgi:hypothetical protein
MAIGKILDHFGLSSPRQQSRPDAREVLRVAGTRRLSATTVGPSLKHHPRATPNPTP